MTQIKEALEWLFVLEDQLSVFDGELSEFDEQSINTIRHILEKLADGHVIVPKKSIDEISKSYGTMPYAIVAIETGEIIAALFDKMNMIAGYQEEVR